MQPLNIQGTLTENADLGSKSWFRCGGKADLFFQPADLDDLSSFLIQIGQSQDLTIIGGLANTIIRDGGIRGVTIQLGRNLSTLRVLDDTYVEAQAGALNGNIAAASVKAGIGGLEFLSGIPGSVGGAIAMNAGAYGAEICDVLVGASVMHRDGSIHRYTAEDFNMAYRRSHVPQNGIVIGAIFKGRKEDYDTVKKRITDIKAKRNDTQPIKEKTGGSTFANPSDQECKEAGLPQGTRAWQVVEKVGGRGYQIGGAQFSEKHCNFMINTGDARASDLENLGNEMIRRAKHELGLTLHWEIKRIGEEG